LKKKVESFLTEEEYKQIKSSQNWGKSPLKNSFTIDTDYNDEIASEIMELLKNKNNKISEFQKNLFLSQLKNYVSGKFSWDISVIKYCLVLKTISSKKVYDTIRGISDDENEYNILLPSWRTLQKYTPEVSYSNGFFLF
jgi:hypothetical protein